MDSNYQLLYGHAKEWGYRAQKEGYHVDQRPAIGAIAWSTRGTHGHVAWVSNVIGDMVESRSTITIIQKRIIVGRLKQVL